VIHISYPRACVLDLSYHSEIFIKQLDNRLNVDSFKYLPRIISAFYQQTELLPELPIPWTQLLHPLKECKFGLVTSGGLYIKNSQPPFDLARELEEPTWGDPTYRIIPSNIHLSEIGVSHLHLNTSDIQADPNILLPIHRFQELLAAGEIGGLAQHAYSFMGYQGFPPNASEWQNTYGPKVARLLKDEGVDCVLLTPA
jgi:hypothetical protein